MIDDYKNELEVLACLFLDKSFFSHAKVQPEEFSSSRYRELYRKLLEMKAEQFLSEEASEWIAEAGRRSKMPVDDVLSALGVSCPYYLEQMRLAHKQRKIKQLADDCDSMSGDDIMFQLRELSADHVSMKHKKEVNIAEYVGSEYLDYLKKKANKETGVVCGRHRLDGLVGFEKGQLVTLAARPSVGKSALALNLAYEWAQYGLNVFYASLEMSVEELTHRLFARVSGVTATKFKYGNVDDAVVMRAKSEIESMAGRVQTAYLPGATVEEVLQSASANTPDVLIVDHIDLLRSSTKTDNEAYAIAAMTSALKAFAGQKDCVVLCLSQFNRESKGGFPELHQLRGSGAKEQDSDTVLILHRELDPDSADFNKTTLRIAKNRSGQVGDIFMQFKPQLTYFEEIATKGLAL